MAGVQRPGCLSLERSRSDDLGTFRERTCHASCNPWNCCWQSIDNAGCRSGSETECRGYLQRFGSSRQSYGLDVAQGFDKCMSDENSAQQQLVPIWSSYSAAIRAQCEGEATAAGSASYLKFEASGLWRGTRTPSLKRRRILGSRSTIMVSCCQVAIRMPANGRSGSFATAQPCWVGLRSPLRDDHGASPHHEYPSLPSALPTASTANPPQAALTRPHAINISLVAWGRVIEKAINGGAKTLEADSHQPRSPLLVGPRRYVGIRTRLSVAHC